MPIEHSKEWWLNMARKEQGDPTTGPPDLMTPPIEPAPDFEAASRISKFLLECPVGSRTTITTQDHNLARAYLALRHSAPPTESAPPPEVAQIIADLRKLARDPISPGPEGAYEWAHDACISMNNAADALAAAARKERDPTPEVADREICECPICGRSHWKLANKPPTKARR